MQPVKQCRACKRIEVAGNWHSEANKELMKPKVTYELSYCPTCYDREEQRLNDNIEGLSPRLETRIQ